MNITILLELFIILFVLFLLTKLRNDLISLKWESNYKRAALLNQKLETNSEWLSKEIRGIFLMIWNSNYHYQGWQPLGIANIIIFDVAFAVASSMVVVVIPVSLNKCLKWKVMQYIIKRACFCFYIWYCSL